MAIQPSKIVEWYMNNMGKITYSMYGSRDGSDGTADCSGSMTTALEYAGCSPAAYLYSTVTLPGYLASNGFVRIAVNQEWDMKAGDVILWSDGADMSSSGGAGGHVMCGVDADNEVSTDWSTRGIPNTAISEYNYDTYWTQNAPNYVEVWRYTPPAPKPAQPAQPEATKPTTTINGEQSMQFIYSYTGSGATYYFDGTTIFGLTTVDELNIIKGTYGQVFGKPIPTIAWTEAQHELWAKLYPVKIAK